MNLPKFDNHVDATQALSCLLRSADSIIEARVSLTSGVIAGWTGRDKQAVEKHIGELEALGVKRPATTPTFYRISTRRFTNGNRLEASGPASSGEVEFTLLKTRGRLWIGVGSDHTDRQVETYSVTVSKQMCDKPIAREFWAYDDVAAHWDQLVLRAHILENGRRELYQEGCVASMIEPIRLIREFTGGGDLTEGTLMLCGTLTARGGIRPATHFDFEIEDPVRNLRITHTYNIVALPLAG